MKLVVRSTPIALLKGDPGAPLRDGETFIAGGRRWTFRRVKGDWATIRTTDTPTGMPYIIIVSPVSTAWARAMDASAAFDEGRTPDDGVYRRVADAA